MEDEIFSTLFDFRFCLELYEILGKFEPMQISTQKSVEEKYLNIWIHSDDLQVVLIVFALTRRMLFFRRS